MKAMSNFSFELTPASAQKLFLPAAERTKKQDEILVMLQKLGEIGSSAERIKVYITKLPGNHADDTVNAVRAVHQFADHLEAVPHIPSRGFKDRNDLKQFIQAMTGSESSREIDFRPIQHVLVVGGSIDEPVGAFSESIQVLESGVLQEDASVKKIGMAAHPQGADNIEQSILENAFNKKLAWANEEMQKTGMEFDWSTQLAYNPQAIIQWEKDLRAGNYNNGSGVKNHFPIRLGIPGPASTAQLAKYAQLSGIGNSINYFKNNPLAAWNLLTKRSVLDNSVVEISNFLEEDKEQMICGFHFFTFGTITQTLEWACKVRDGQFDVTDAGKIVVQNDR